MNAQAEYNAPAEPIDLDHYKELNVGQILRRTREYYGQSVGQVEVNLRIRASHIQAIEAVDLSRLPGRVYAIGFVRAYSEYLGLDGDKMVHLFKAQSVGKKNRPELQFKVANYETQTPNVYVILGCTLAAILLIAYLSMTYTPSRYIEVIPPVPEELKKSSLAPKAPKSIEDIIEEDQKLLSTNKPEIELVVSEDSWVEIQDKEGNILVSEVLKPGDKYIVPKDQEGLVLATGNAGGITVFMKGKKLGELGEHAEVKRGIALNPEKLKP
ncbi:MAG: RodZ domain-containing protein [Pseudomonadota bacterium]